MQRWSEYENENDDHITGSLPTSSSTESSMYFARSSSISLPKSHIPRTESELKLSLDEAAAEHRDAVMLCRLVRGIRRHQASSNSPQRSFMQPDLSLGALLRTRLAHVDEHSFSTQQGRRNDFEPQQSTTQQPLTDGAMAGSSGWSITGYELELQQPMTGFQVPVFESLAPPSLSILIGDHQNHDGDYDEEGVFTLDL